MHLSIQEHEPQRTVSVVEVKDGKNLNLFS